MATGTTTRATALTDRGAAPWSLAEERLRNPERPRTYWLATVGPDGAPHVMPLIAAWLDDALYFLSGEGTRKGRNLAHEARCVVATGSTTLPSLDLIIEGRAERITDQETLRRGVEAYGTKLEWPLELSDGGVTGPNAPTAGPPPYAMFRLVPSRIFGLPGMLGMEQFEPGDLPRPTRWDRG
ncbi:MAG TPA: pyridoxamine 5'-phosphate oxidase family protein [Acidimicrobiales bacterium]|nr:pyridoxamine 5'-phosphate oxidase family protein [Acidimicrobiales bacterium]